VSTTAWARPSSPVDAYFILLPAALTSWAALRLLRRRGAAAGAWREPLARTLECVGLTVVFAVVNTLLGAVLTLLLRAVARGFVSLYLTTDSVLLGISALQAIAFRWWWDTNERKDG
jgi:hypothetical protein